MGIQTTNDTDFLWDTRKLKELPYGTEVKFVIGDDQGKEHQCKAVYDDQGWRIYVPDGVTLGEREVAHIGEELEMLRTGPGNDVFKVDRDKQTVTNTGKRKR